MMDIHIISLIEMLYNKHILTNKHWNLIIGKEWTFLVWHFKTSTSICTLLSLKFVEPVTRDFLTDHWCTVSECYCYQYKNSFTHPLHICLALFLSENLNLGAILSSIHLIIYDKISLMILKDSYPWIFDKIRMCLSWTPPPPQSPYVD